MGVQPDLVAHQSVHIDRLYLPDYSAGFFSYRRLQAEAHEKVQQQELKPGEILEFGPGVKGKVLFGQTEDVSPDEAAHVIYLKYGDVSFLLMSHLSAELEEELTVEWGDSLQADVLKVGRHGAAGATTAELLEFVQPSYAVISTSSENPLNAPDEQVIQRLQDAGVRSNNIYRTDEQADIAIYTDGRAVRIESGAMPSF